MAERIVLHVGAMKSGTSYVQRLLATNARLLSDRGMLFPGRSWQAQVRGVARVLERKRVVTRPPKGAWQALVDEVDAGPAAAVISMEFLGPAASAGIDRVVGSFPPGGVDVVVTARDLGRTVPAMWQETLKNGRSRTFEEYVAAVGGGGGPGTRFWREQDIAAMCRRWGDAVGLDRVVLVTVPPPGARSEELWTRFASAIGIDPADVEVPEPANESLGAASAEVLRRLNALLDGMDYGDYAPLVKHQLAKRILGARRAQEPAVGFDMPPWLQERSAAMIKSLREMRVRVVGDLADLEPLPVPGVSPGAVAVDAQLEAALAALDGLVRIQVAAAPKRGARSKGPGVPTPLGPGV